MREKLVRVLQQAGKATSEYRSPDGSVVLILPYGGRVLGLFAPGSAENFYWTHPALENTDSARAFFCSEQWQNTGGDRTWLAPEVDFFFPQFPDRSVYSQPRQLDPGNYELIRAGNRVSWTNRCLITASRSHDELDLQLTKSVGPAPNPLRRERGFDLRDVTYAGYTLRTSLELLSGAPGRGTTGLWNLVQMPHGGDLLIPTYGTAEPKVYFGEIPTTNLTVRSGLVRYHMRASGEQKLGVRAVSSTGRVGYLYRTGTAVALIVRNFAVNPSGEYVDVPWQDTDDLGYATQACNVNSPLGQFSELEYHTPAIGGRADPTRCDDAAQVWAFRGPEETIDQIAVCLLGAGLEH